VKYHNLELGENLAVVLDTHNAAADKMLADYGAQKKKYDEQAKEIQSEAQKDEEGAESDERRALRYDIGEGMLEIGLVLSSLYFISRKKMFPVLGLAAGAAGLAVAISGLLV
jgi:hypothetical protein